MRGAEFLREFLREPLETGAVSPSSPQLADLITDAARLDRASVVVEFGPGTGVFTERILRKLPGTAVFLALEVKERFAEATRRRCPGVTVHLDSAVNVRRYLSALGLDQCDCIVCGLPWASFSNELQDELLQTTLTVLKPGGRFVTFAYLQGLLLPAGQRFKLKLKTRFRQVTRTDTVWLNLPPAFVYCAVK